GAIDILSVQFSGANMHPICYEMTEEEYQKTSRQKKMRKFVAVRNFIRDLKPRYYIPSAGPAVFSLPEHYKLNFETESIFPKWWQFKEYLEGKDISALFVPLDVLGSAAAEACGSVRFDGIAEKLSDEQIKKFIDYYRSVDAKGPKAPKL